MINGRRQVLSQRNISRIPEESGVFALFSPRAVLYYGITSHSGLTLKDCLQSVFDGTFSKGLKISTSGFSVEPTITPMRRRRELLIEHLERYGRLPPGNGERDLELPTYLPYRGITMPVEQQDMPAAPVLEFPSAMVVQFDAIKNNPVTQPFHETVGA
jgi:hypothetical protein